MDLLHSCNLVLCVHGAEPPMDLLQDPEETTVTSHRQTDTRSGNDTLLARGLRKVPLTSEPRASAVQPGHDDLPRSHQHPVPVRPELLRHHLAAWRTAAVGTPPDTSVEGGAPNMLHMLTYTGQREE